MSMMKKIEKVDKYRTSMNIEDACEKAGISSPTYYKYKNNPIVPTVSPKVIVYQGKQTRKYTRKPTPAPDLFTPNQVAALLLAVRNG